MPPYPRAVNYSFGIPASIDAALSLEEYNKTYFFKYDNVWRYDEKNKAVDSGYPYHVREVWEGVPPPVHAAFNYTDGKFEILD